MLRYIIKNSLAICFYLLGGLIILKIMLRKQSSLFVLLYHNFSMFHNFKAKRGSIIETGYGDNFERQIRFLQKHFSFCYPEEFFNQPDKINSGINVLITFDDGYKDNYDIAYPILKRHNSKAIFFIPTQLIGTDDWLWHDKIHYLVNKGIIDANESARVRLKMNNGVRVPEDFRSRIDSNFKYESNQRMIMNWDEIIELNESGFKIGSHTCNHQILSFVDEKIQEEEINDSIKSIKENADIDCSLFAYPNGLYNSQTLELLEKGVIQYAFTTIKGVNTPEQEKLEIKRIGINSSDSIYLILLKFFISTVRGN